jgi:mannose-1-phosphate guanylyltransferase
MNIILLSGGSGARLWPLSNEARSKQFLRLIQDERGNIQSMVQRVFGQIQASGLNPKTITVATSDAQAEAIRGQIGEGVELVTEPERRNTWPAIALACAWLHWEKSVGPKESVVVLPVDPYAEIGYFQTLSKLAAIVESGDCNLALMGVKPSYPSAKYGYMTPRAEGNSGGAENERIRIKGFVEKPEEEKAAQLIREGALWNCGVFAFRMDYMLDKIRRAVPANSFAELRRRYGELTKDSFDYEVAEKETSIAMIPYNGYWKDLGTWNTFTEQMGRGVLGNALVDAFCENTHVINELDTPLIVLGAKDMVVAASYDGILVADKERSAALKPYVEQIQQRPMYEERRWGEYRVLDYVTHADGGKTLTKRMFILAGKSISYQLHHHRAEVWTIVSGEGEFMLNDERRVVRQGDVLQIPVGAKHAIRATRDLEIIEVQMGTELEESDVVRLAMDW